MRIGFTGSQGTGKTSLANAYLQKVNGTYPRKPEDRWLIVPSTARKAQEAGFSINRDADQLSQLVTTIARINAENEAAATERNILSERTPIDSLAYTAWQFNNVWKVKSPYYWHQCMDLVKHHMPLYDSVILFPPYWEPKDDGVRDSDVGWQHEIHELVVSILEHHGVEYSVMPNVDVKSRLVWLENHLTEIRKTDTL